MDNLTNITIENAQEFLINRMDVEQIFSLIERSDYVILYQIEKMQKTGRVYMKELSECLNLTIPQLSRMVSHLQDDGFLLWETDERKNNTYVSLTTKATELMDKQKENILSCYRDIKFEIPEEELQLTMETMGKIRKIMLECIQ